ncbi:hypothetical protein P43SY_010240 [Pythium insidiosum]|uniref:Uncharacterized protein n=1 Tax=Pythium insidiosum TaxID=114742 RepID=A0AAD5LTN8_PYTIN|nr:hypothetical protein P43SY_010240 [Pythium insidiosum]
MEPALDNSSDAHDGTIQADAGVDAEAMDIQSDLSTVASAHDTALVPVFPAPLFLNSWSPISPASSPTIDGPELLASPAAVRDDANPFAKPARALKQLALSAFYGPRSVAEAQAMLETELLSRQPDPTPDWPALFPSPTLDSALAVLRAPVTLRDWATALHARVVTTPGTGGCLYFALHGARTRHLAGASMTICNFHVKEGKFYKNKVCDTLEKYLESMLASGTITIADFQRRFPTPLPAARDAALVMIKNHIAGVRAAPVTKMSPLQWGGDEEIFAAVWFVREPIVVITEGSDRQTSTRVIWLDRSSPTGPEEIYHHLPTPGEAFEILRVFLSHRVTPMVLVHVASHFNCLRFDEAFYKRWTADDISGEKMRARLDHALARLGCQTSPALANLLVAWELVDAVSDDMLGAQSRTEVTAFHGRYHSYYYSTPDGHLASARLDRCCAATLGMQERPTNPHAPSSADCP